MKTPNSLAKVAGEVLSGGDTPRVREETFSFSFRNFLDDFYAADDETRQAMLGEEPALLRDSLQDGGVADSYLAALANHLAGQYRLIPPAWAAVTCLHRIPDKPWFAMKHPDSRVWLLTESPASFRERNLFISRDALTRA